jgi:hypothetical protein
MREQERRKHGLTMSGADVARVVERFAVGLVAVGRRRATSLVHRSPPQCTASGTLAFGFRPRCTPVPHPGRQRHDCFPSTVQKPAQRSCPLYTGHRLARNETTCQTDPRRVSDLRQRGVGGTSWPSEGGRQRETVHRHVLAGELEGNYIVSILQGSGVGSKLADFCNTASVRSRQYVLVRGSSEGWCRRSETAPPTAERTKNNKKGSQCNKKG